jgi:hypothetical protein
MKKVPLIAVMIICYFSVYAQDTKINFPIDSITKEVVFTEVVNIPNSSAQDIYSRAKLFVAEYYKSAKSVTQLNDDNQKVVFIRPIIQNYIKSLLVSGEWGFTSYSLKIECKDNKCRYTITDLYHHKDLSTRKDGGNLNQVKATYYPDKWWNQFREQDYTEIDLLIKSLKKEMAKTTASNNW